MICCRHIGCKRHRVRSPGTLLGGSRSHSMGCRVLVVDDDPLVLELVASMLEELGCETLRARLGTDALGTIARVQTIDVLIADIDMPGLKGSELAERARNFRAELPVILLTGAKVDGGIPDVARTSDFVRS
jgi:two-component system cell cycle response regulator CpdR